MIVLRFAVALAYLRLLTMKIQRIEPVPLTAPFTFQGLPASHPYNGVRNCVWLRIDTDEGITGWGEVYLGCYATEVAIASLKRFCHGLTGKDPMDPVSLMEEARYDNRYWAMRGIGAQSSSAVEGALWDIVGKAKQQPVWKLLGDGRPRPILPYASAGIGELSPREIHDEVKRFTARGYRAYKMSCGGFPVTQDGEMKRDIERVAAAREALGPERLLFVDVFVPQRRRTWKQSQAEAYMRALHPYHVGFMEEPAMTYDVRGYRELQALKLIPTAGGESFSCPEEFEPFFEAGALGVAQPDAAVVGGPASSAAVCRRAHALGVPVCPHAYSAGVGLAQNLHAAWSTEGVLAVEFPQEIHPLAKEPLKEIWNFKDGHVAPPDRPGLGVVITEEFLIKYAYQPNPVRNY